MLRRIEQLSAEYELRVADVFHAGDGNLHPLILFDANKDGETARTVALASQILQLCVQVGGTITGEHGVGVEKITEMCVQFEQHALTQFFPIKPLALTERRCILDPFAKLSQAERLPTMLNA